MARLLASVGGRSALCICNRPRWEDVYKNYPWKNKNADTYDDEDAKTVFKEILGKQYDGKNGIYTDANGRKTSFENACATRVSIALVKSGMEMRKDFLIQAGELKGKGFIASAKGLKEWLSLPGVWGEVKGIPGKISEEEEINEEIALERVAKEIGGRSGVYIILDNGDKRVKDHATLWLGEHGDIIGGHKHLGKGGTIYFWELKGESQINIEIDDSTHYGSLDQAVMEAANKIYEHMKNDGRYEYGITIFEDKNVKEKFYLTNVRRGTRWDITVDGITVDNDEINNEMLKICKEYEPNNIHIPKECKALDKKYVAHVHSHPKEGGQAFSMTDYCNAYGCYPDYGGNYKCHILSHFNADCKKEHKRACKQCKNNDDCENKNPKNYTYLVTPLKEFKYRDDDGKEQSMVCNEGVLMMFDPPSRMKYDDDKRGWFMLPLYVVESKPHKVEFNLGYCSSFLDDTPELPEKRHAQKTIFEYCVKATSIVMGTIDRPIDWKENIKYTLSEK